MNSSLRWAALERLSNEFDVSRKSCSQGVHSSKGLRQTPSRIRQIQRRIGAIIALFTITSTACVFAAENQEAELEIAHTNLLKTAQTAPKSTCTYAAKERVIVCAYIQWTDAKTRIDLYEIESRDGGSSWSNPKQITSDPGDEYDPYIAYDANKDRIWLIYATWHDHRGGNHNDILVRFKDCVACDWSPEKVVVADGAHDYWIPSFLALTDGKLLALYTKDGPESSAGTGSGKIALRRSLDNGRTWGPEIIPTKSCDAEYPRAVQNSTGSVLLVFSKYVDTSHLSNGTPCADGMAGKFPYSDIHQVWSNDDGQTWKGESVLYHGADGPALHPYVTLETIRPQTPCAACAMDLVFIKPDHGFAAYRLQSLDQGLTWRGLTKISVSSWPSAFNIDPGVFTDCRGLLANYTAGFGGENVYLKRLDSLDRCR